MYEIHLILSNKWKQFKLQKGMLIFYCLLIVLLDLVLPVTILAPSRTFAISTFVTVLLLKPLLADSIASEREYGTLESLLSTPITGRAIAFGNVLFGFCFAAIMVAFHLLLQGVFYHKYINFPLMSSVWQWAYFLFTTAFMFLTISLRGVIISAHSENSHTANSRISLFSYALSMLVLGIQMDLWKGDINLSASTSIVLFLFCLPWILHDLYKLYHMKQKDFYQIRPSHFFKKANRTHTLHPLLHQENSSYKVSPVLSVMRHEFKYLLTLRTLLLNFLLLVIAPAIFVLLIWYYTGKANLNSAILITILMIPRIPTNLVAYSVGGEKVYKTGESLLSTPVSLSELFLAKAMIPVIVSVIILLCSSLLTLLTANLIQPNTYYTISQLLVLYPIGLLSACCVIFITAALSILCKTPRQGLYFTSLIGPLFAIVPAILLYAPSHSLIWPVLYLILLFVSNLLFLSTILRKATRPFVVSKL